MMSVWLGHPNKLSIYVPASLSRCQPGAIFCASVLLFTSHMSWAAISFWWWWGIFNVHGSNVFPTGVKWEGILVFRTIKGTETEDRRHKGRSAVSRATDIFRGDFSMWLRSWELYRISVRKHIQFLKVFTVAASKVGALHLVCIWKFERSIGTVTTLKIRVWCWNPAVQSLSLFHWLLLYR